MFKNRISIEDKDLLNQYIHHYPYCTSDINFTNLFMWRHLNNHTYEVINDLLCIAGTFYGKPFLFPPLSKGDYDKTQIADTIDILKQRFEEADHPFVMKILPAHMVEILRDAKPDELKFHRDRDNDDYVYLSKDLIGLKGRKFHAKKNHWNYFMKHVPHEYVPLTPDLIDECLHLARQLQEGDYTPVQVMLLENEERAIHEALTHMDELDITGAAIRINGKVEAFTFGEKLNDQTFLVHIEKANAQIKGLYQAINQQFCQHSCKNFKYVNREEDMGFDYLRKAKKSYRPVKMIEKYDVTMI